MNLKHALFIFIFVIGCYPSFSQVNQYVKDANDSLVVKKNTSINKKRIRTIKPTTDFDQRFSFFKNSQVNIWGQKIGVLINDEWKVGMGGYFLKDKFQGVKLNTTSPTPSNVYINRDLYFGTVYLEPFLFRKPWWELSIPFEVGVGKTTLTYYYASDNAQYDTKIKYFFPTGLGLSLSLKLPPGETFKPFRWIGINFLAGYRYDLYQHLYNTDYDGAFWSVSGAIFLDRIFDDYKGWKKKRGEVKK